MNSRMQSVRGGCLAALVLLLAGCATTSTLPGLNGSSVNAPQTAAQAERQGDYAQAARDYSQAAETASQASIARHDRFQAGLDAAQAGDANEARRLLGNVNPNTLSSVEHAQFNLAQREIAIAHLSPDDALSHLPAPAQDTAPSVAERVWEKRATLQFADNNMVAGIQALVNRDAWLNSPVAMRANDNRIYQKATDAIGLGIGPNSADAQSASQTTRGWLALAAIGETQYSSTDARNQAIARWQQNYPGHPANRSVLAEQFDYQGNSNTLPSSAPLQNQNPSAGIVSAGNRQVALALPVQGEFQNAAEAIRDGFEFAYQNDNAGLPQPVLYDTSNMNAAQLASKVGQDNVGVLVGPLDKSKVAGMANQSLPIPEIALNTIDQPVAQAGFYQLGLGPADEAAAAARHALQQGFHNALVLVPSGNWGDRVIASFRKTLTNGGGQILASARYDESSHDHSQPIQQLLAGNNLNTADFIFVAAQPTQARLIRSQLKYFNAGSLPMVTTSQSYSGQVDPAVDIDLDGVYFVDMPWLLGSGGTIERLRSEAASAYGDEATAYARLFALGMDAWLLARRVVNGNLQTDQPIEGMTGVLDVEPNGHVTRYLGWAVFRDGRPNTLSMPSISQAETANANYSAPSPVDNTGDTDDNTSGPSDTDSDASAPGAGTATAADNATSDSP